MGRLDLFTSVKDKIVKTRLMKKRTKQLREKPYLAEVINYNLPPEEEIQDIELREFLAFCQRTADLQIFCDDLALYLGEI